MVGSALPRGTSCESLTNDEYHGEKPRWQAQPRGTLQHGSHPRQHQTKHYSGGDSGKRNGQRAAKCSNHGVGGTPDVTGRINVPSVACSSGRSFPLSNLDRFLEETTPCVKVLTLPKSRLRDPSNRWFNPEETPYFNLGDLWDSFDEWSAYGAGVPLTLNGDESVVQYYVPYLSALQLYTVPSRRPDRPAGYRHPGSESDTCSEASSDGEGEKSSHSYDVAESSSLNLGNSSRLVASTYISDNDEVMVWSFFEKSQPYSRVPLVNKIADLSRGFSKPENNPLRTLRSLDLLPKSWLSVAWYPIYRIPTGPTLRDLSACFLTFHPLSTSLKVGEGSLRQGSRGDECITPSRCPLDAKPLRAFGLASYKLRGAVWSSNPEKRLATTLQHVADEHLKDLCVDHPDFNYFTSRTSPTSL
ncbi:uncharacterized protein [Physcomitrium patens]|uniref:Uncharacterized protein n=1 Tax=Physcomitrium patens TaxID=3218 RepID=A0A2K1L9N7_PHYPA|nr:uncharacterized protein LOC112291489 isoform X2 [Physcomitrium patens]PNR62749.1 hypothetical protein PHYPA_001173 [Physcomitrium patens]|eukprot:XP_024394749.1 uncharacterized protein LOC112291489 isoform X2 [Physcomitrella patens]